MPPVASQSWDESACPRRGFTSSRNLEFDEGHDNITREPSELHDGELLPRHARSDIQFAAGCGTGCDGLRHLGKQNGVLQTGAASRVHPVRLRGGEDALC